VTSPVITSADVLVIFGITGDLARKMTFRSLYRMERRGLLDCPIVGVALDEWSDDALRDHARKAIEAAGEVVDENVFARLAARMSMVSGDFGDPATYGRVATAIAGSQTPVFYLEIPPSLFGRVVEGLAGANLTGRARVVVEKPFGHDLASARALNADLSKLLARGLILGARIASTQRGPKGGTKRVNIRRHGSHGSHVLTGSAMQGSVCELRCHEGWGSGNPRVWIDRRSMLPIG
jgi:glucose-6-phosphate 1-dehydrogenase